MQLRYLLKLPSMRQSERKSKPSRRRSQGNSNAQSTAMKSSTYHQWSYKLGAQLDDFNVKLCGDIRKTTTSNRESQRPILMEIEGRMTDLSVAIRVGNHRPVTNATQPVIDRVFRDFQISIGDFGIHEVMHHRVRAKKNRFGDFSALSEHSLFGTLLCLNDTDLLSIMGAFRIRPLRPPARSIPSPMLTWQLTNQIAKEFRMEGSNARAVPFDSRSHSSSKPISTPLLTSWNRVKAQSSRPNSLLSLFVRNYGETTDRQKIVAASLESVDVALTTSSLYCVTSLLDAFDTSSSYVATTQTRVDDPSGALSDDETLCDDSNAESPFAAGVTARHQAATLEDIQMSLVTGQIRLVLPNEALSEALVMDHSVCPGNVMLVIESSSVLSSVWNEISLDGLGYPPFNATKLPRRQRAPSQRLGESKLRLWCKIGKIYGVVADFARSDGQQSREVDPPGPFEHFLSHRNEGASIDACATATFLLPFNIAVDIEEASGGESKSSKRTVLSITKVRLEVRKQDYGAVLARIASYVHALFCLLQSPVWKPKRSISVGSELDNKPTPTGTTTSSSQAVFEFASDGVEVALSNSASSIHVRVGSMSILHDWSDGSGSFSIQNVVTGFRCAADASSNVGALVAKEELVFGVFLDPALWQLGADNYPEKMLSGRWSSLDHNERTIFLDIQAYQLHLSLHFLEELKEFLQSSTSRTYSIKASRVRADASRGSGTGEGRRYSPRSKTTAKILIAPSIISLWERTLQKEKTPDIATCVWITCGQVFASVGIGSEGWTTRYKLLAADEDAVHELSRYFSVRETDFMANLEKIGVKTSSDMPILGIEFRYGTVGSLPSHIASTWASFSRHLNSGSARLRVLEDCTIRVTGDFNKILERKDASRTASKSLLATSLTRLNLQGEVSAVAVKVSSHSIESVMSLLGALKPVQSVKSPGYTTSPSSRVDKHAELSQVSPVTKAPSSKDDFNYLRRVAEARHPAPGELVLTESLFIETGNSAGALLQPQQASTLVQIDELQFNNYEQIEGEDLLSFIDEINLPWEVESSELPPSDSATLGSVFENKTMSWMGMRWCYHIPRVIDEIVANPVPIPPTGMPNGWPTWNGNSENESDSVRLCDIFCQLRCWDYRSNHFVIVSEFFVPWERSTNSRYRIDASELYEPESFGDFVNQWFEEDMEDYAYHAKLLELASATRRVQLRDAPPSDKWELRWRSPIVIDKEAEVLCVFIRLGSSIVIVDTLGSSNLCILLAFVLLSSINRSACS